MSGSDERKDGLTRKELLGDGGEWPPRHAAGPGRAQRALAAAKGSGATSPG